MPCTAHYSKPVQLSAPARLLPPGRLLTPASSLAEAVAAEDATNILHVDAEQDGQDAGEKEQQLIVVKGEGGSSKGITAVSQEPDQMLPSPPESPRKYFRGARGRRSTGPNAQGEEGDRNRQNTPDLVTGPMSILELDDRLRKEVKGKKRVKE